MRIMLAHELRIAMFVVVAATASGAEAQTQFGGVFLNPVAASGSTVVSGAGSSTILWGTPANGSTQSGLQFIGNHFDAGDIDPFSPFIVGVLGFQNGETLAGTEIRQVTLNNFTLFSDFGVLQGQSNLARITIVTTPNVTGTAQGDADFIYFTDQPGLGSFRVFENHAGFALVPLVFRVGSLDLVGFGTPIDPSISFLSPSVDAIPEPSVTLLLGAGLAAVAFASRRRHSRG